MSNLAEKAAAAAGWRLLWLGLLMALGMGYLVFVLYGIQIRDTRTYASAQEMHTFRRVRLPATRGRILDCRGRVVADNRPSFCISLYIEEMREPGPWSNTVNRVDGMIDKLSQFLDSPRIVDRDGIWAHIYRRRAIPLVAFDGLCDRAVARFSENAGKFPGADISVRAERVYPYGDSACHVIGYVGKGQPGGETGEPDGEEEEDFDFLLPDLAGRSGVEKSCDKELAGMCGGELIQINVVGYKHKSVIGQEPVPGKDVRLTLDMRIQNAAEAALGNERGAVVVMNCRTGELLALASAPRYDLSLFTPSLHASDWKALLDNPNRPLYSRAAAGVYPPGSVFKPVVAMSVLSHGGVDPHQLYDCTGFVMVGGRRIRCAHRHGHGHPLDMAGALAESCNPYFIELARGIGWEPYIRADAEALGLGAAPEVEIFAAAGVLPSEEWKRRRFGEGWRGGDTANVAIGQGFLAATPLQVAVFTSAIANGGNVLRPRLVLHDGETPGAAAANVIRHMNWKSGDLKIVHKGMFDAVNTASGTGRRAYIPEVSVAGKTGTAEYMDGGEKKKNAWMIAFAPYEDPEYAFVTMVEDSDAGGMSAALVLKEVLKSVYVPDYAPGPELKHTDAEEDFAAFSGDADVMEDAPESPRFDAYVENMDASEEEGAGGTDADVADAVEGDVGE